MTHYFLAMSFYSLLIVLGVHYGSVSDAEEITTYTDKMVYSSSQATSFRTIDQTGVIERLQNFTSSTTLTPTSTAWFFLVTMTDKSKERVESPFDHVMNHFSDFKSQVVALNYEYCGHTCNFTYGMTTYSDNIYCDKCSCNDDCQETGDCCPDLILLHNRTQNPLYPGCISTEFPLTVLTNFYLMISSCPASYNASFIKTHCENPPLTDWSDVVLQVNVDTWTSFKNIYCAVCHGQNNTHNWESSITCSSFDRTLQESTSLLELFNTILVSKTCSVQFKPPELAKRQCRQRNGAIVERCNVTGLWLVYDKNIEDACRAFSQVVFGEYRNIFCYYCNNQDYWERILTMKSPYETQNPMTVSLTALIDIGSGLAYRHSDRSLNTKFQSNENNSESMVTYLKQCKNQSVSCAEGKQLHGDECRSLFASSNMYGYRVCFQINITLTEQVASTSDLGSLVYHNFPQVNYTFLAMTNITGYVVELQNCPHKEMFVTIRYVMFIYSVLTLNRDQFEKQLMEDDTMILADSKDLFQYHAGCSSKPVLALRRGDEQHCTSRIIQFDWVQFLPMSYDDKDIANGAEYIQLSKQLNCPRIVLDSSDYIISLHNTSNFIEKKTLQFPTLLLPGRQKALKHDEFQVLNDGSVVVCVGDYLDITSQTTYSCNDEYHMAGTMYLGIFSFVCTSVSLLCLALTFGTYCMFASMRTLGGVCNMGLIATIFAAQAVYEFGMEQNENVIGCQVIGIVIHFLWLAAVFWMNACTFLLFLKLSFPLKCRNIGYNLKKTFCLSALYSNGSSALMVCINIVINTVSRGEIGYGGRVCYLNTNVSLIYFFKIPMGVTVMLNIGLFVFTFCRIGRHESITSTRESKINLLACVKLSVITGLVWLFSYLYEVFQITAFAYLFTLFVGLQGVFFFLAIVINKNVLSLWSSYCRRKKRESITRTSDTNSSALFDSSTRQSNISHSDSCEQDGRRSKTRV